MTWVIAIAGFCALIVAHEAGHFLAAKAVGMRVERFSLFFPPKLAAFTRGETEYQIGALPLGGYVKITGMTPDELRTLDLRLAERSYYMKAPWKRIVVILAGPGVNLLIALVLFAVVLMSGSLDGATAIGNLAPSQQTLVAIDTSPVAGVLNGTGAAGRLDVGDRIVAVDGHRVTTHSLAGLLEAHRCAGVPVNGCAAAMPARLTVARKGTTVTVLVTPHYSAANRKMELGVELSRVGPASFSLLRGIGTSAAAMWEIGTSTVGDYVKGLVNSKVRKQFSSIIGITQTTQQAVARGPGFALVVLALVSLVLAVVNLFPFLPLDGGHVLWSVVEKARGRRVSLAAMWRFSSVGVLLLAFLVLNGISNDISRLSG